MTPRSYSILSLRNVALLVLTLCITSLSVYAGDEAPIARAYFDWVFTNIEKTRADIAPITAAAEDAVPLIIDGKTFGIQESGIAEEIAGRAGGFYMIIGYRGKPGDLVLYPIGSRPAKELDEKAYVQRLIADMKRLKDADSLVVSVVSFAQLTRLGLLEDARAASNHMLDNHAPAVDGMFKDAQGKEIIPTFTVANAITSWAFCGELYSALTRKGKAAVLYQSGVMPGGSDRNKTRKGMRFESITIEPIEAGVMTQLFLDRIKSLLTDVSTTSWPDLVRAADRIYETRADGGTAWTYVFAHYPPHTFGGSLAADPQITSVINRRTKFTSHAKAGDSIMVLGYILPPYHPAYGERAEYEAADKGTIWLISDYRNSRAELGKNDILVDEYWKEGDAMVPIKGYDARMIPPSGIMTEAVGWAIIAQANHDYEAHVLSKEKAKQRMEQRQPVGAGSN